MGDAMAASQTLNKNKELENVNGIDNNKLTQKEDATAIGPANQSETSEVKDICQKEKAAQYYKKIDPVFLTMLSTQTSKRFVALFRNALTVRVIDIKNTIQHKTKLVADENSNKIEGIDQNERTQD